VAAVNATIRAAARKCGRRPAASHRVWDCAGQVTFASQVRQSRVNSCNGGTLYQNSAPGGMETMLCRSDQIRPGAARRWVD
jgi:hypothetical protein